MRKEFRTELKTPTQRFFFDPFRCCSPGGRWSHKSVPSQVGQGSITFFHKTGRYFSEFPLNNEIKCILRHGDGDESHFSLDIMDRYSVSFGRIVIAIAVIS